MRKLMNLCSLVLLILIGCNTAEQKNDLKEEGLKGKVKSVRKNTYKATEKFGKIEKESEVTADNMEVELKKEIEDAAPNAYIEYNLQGNKTRLEVYRTTEVAIAGSDNTDDNVEYHYTKEYFFTYHYDDKGNKIKAEGYNTEGNLDGKMTYHYDDKGNMVKIEGYNTEGNLYLKMTYHYDDKGNIVKSELDIKSNSYYGKMTYRYDGKGNKIEESRYNSDGGLLNKCIYRYDDKGNKIERNWYDKDGIIKNKWTYQYQYDDQGNWVEKAIYIDDKPHIIVTRKIEYYN